MTTATAMKMQIQKPMRRGVGERSIEGWLTGLELGRVAILEPL
jgi:hypothetical protein